MLYLITGGSGSGKSEYAEKRIGELCENAGGGEKLYVATMIPYGEETKQKIARHRQMRAAKAFTTKECYRNLQEFAEMQIRNMEEPPFVLLECMSNLIANEMFEPGGTEKSVSGEKLDSDCSDLSVPKGQERYIVRKVTRGLKLLTDCCRDVVVVTNEVCSESAEDSAEMREYKQVLAAVNCWMAEQAAEVTEVVYGMPYDLKASEKANNRAENGRAGMRLIVGGAFQGKMEYARKQYPGIQWTDGAKCKFEEILSYDGMYHFETYIRRLMLQERGVKASEEPDEMPMQGGTDGRLMCEEPDEMPIQRQQVKTITTGNLVERILMKNPGMILSGNEIGYGLVPVDAFERNYREQYGRICTQLASRAERVDRVVCGIGIRLKSEVE